MSRMIQIRNVPDTLHRKLKSRAAVEGLSLADYLRLEIERVAERPTPRELAERIRSRTSAPVRPLAAAILGHERNTR